MKQSIKKLILVASVTGLSAMLSACAGTGKIDYNDDVETPDVLLEDAKGGDSDYGLDKNAAQNNHQNKPDGLEQSTGSRSSASAASPRQTERVEVETQPQQTRRVEPQVTRTKPLKKTKPKTQKPRKEPSKQESALEVDDPLLGEIDPN